MAIKPVSKENWRSFINDGCIEENNMPNELIDSWKLCRQQGVNPFNGVADRILDENDLKQRLKKNQLLIDLAEPHINKLGRFLRGWKFITVLTDKDGYILRSNGDRSVKQEANGIQFYEGAKWDEAEVGSNAIGLAQRFIKSFAIRGFEHFAVASQMWNCSASPILDHNKNLLGILNISSLYPSINHNYVLASVKLAADSISLNWRNKIQEDIELLMKNKYSLDPHSVVCTSDHIVYSLPRELLPSYHKYIGEPLKKFREEVKLCEIDIPITTGNRVIGYRIPIDMAEEEEASSVYFQGVTGTSKSFQKVLEAVRKVAPTNAAVHIYGETGTGKELVAQAIHENSSRADGPYVSLNCGAIPEQLLESELFGYEPGAFTGASKKGYKGKLEMADGGTLFLDEIGDMSESMQVALLRVLQQKELTRIGGDHSIKVNVRIISAANVDIRKLVQQGKMREDLFYRIYVFPITVPPLRERKEDIKALIKDYCRRTNWYPGWLNKLETIFTKGSWSGNIRELHNALERCNILFSDITPTDKDLHELMSSWDQFNQSDSGETFADFREQLEYNNIQQALTNNNGNVPQAAKELRISRSTLYRKMKRYNL
ncbi:AAA domain-containing protein [Virgibacillus dakarensis]|uniref:Sigma-54-dependent Fis family transcriptional regulator n=1 Tax=Lentibacillus populi TaxID=1827502 RepID=A0A9W5TW77_9BACI|nr:MULTISPECIES: sigma-54-dependent Fis family transcriptional regulator [Bacillaceae]MBT2217281.1 sigma-54-dependent Fis family transcriptional regulator [Virgibacillus dakarensis]MTW86784.1 AAA domain-containing protein [Virgibacillus dakarensis]GGB38326.1 sigma-54-dependent Fis family transcriptional regulator [Lentibacillus populi]